MTHLGHAGIGKKILFVVVIAFWVKSDLVTPNLSLRHHAQEPLARHQMYMVHKIGFEEVIWLDSTGFWRDFGVSVTFFNCPLGSKAVVMLYFPHGRRKP